MLATQHLAARWLALPTLPTETRFDMITYQEMRKMLAQDKLAKLIEAMHAATAHTDDDLNNEVITIAGRFSRINNQLNTGQVSHEEANQERSRISAALLDVLNRLQGAYPQLTVPTPISQAPSATTYASTSAPAAQSRPVWPYVLAGVVGCIILLGIIGSLSGNQKADQTEEASPLETTLQVQDKDKSSNMGIKSSLTDEPPAQQQETTTEEPVATSSSSRSLVGTWHFSLSDGSTYVDTSIQFNSDGTYASAAYMNGALIGEDHGSWRTSGNTLYQTSSNDGPSRYTIHWDNARQFTATDPEEGIPITFTKE